MGGEKKTIKLEISLDDANSIVFAAIWAGQDCIRDFNRSPYTAYRNMADRWFSIARSIDDQIKDKQ